MEKILFALLVLLASGAAQAQEAQTSVAHGAGIVSDSLHTSAPTDTLLSMDDQTLDEVVVSVRRPTLSARLDRKVYQVGQDVAGSVGSLSDLLQNVPSVDIDIDGNVSLRGSDQVTILVNGKPSAMLNGKTREDALSQFAASSIERIEVITAPSAEYKPDGTAGIINIVLKKNAPTGVNATATANLGSVGRQNAGINVGWGMRHLRLNAGYTYRRDRYDRTTDDQRTTAASHIDQQTYGLGRPVSHTFRLGLGADLTAHDQLSVEGNYNRRRFQRDEWVSSITSFTDATREPEQYHRDRSAMAHERMWEATARYTHTYGTDNEWGIDYTQSYEAEDEDNDYTTLRASTETRDAQWVWDMNRLQVATLHWRHRLSELTKLSAGYELEHLRAEQSFHLSDWDGAAYQPNATESSDFRHLRTLHTLYATLETRLWRWNILAGVRGERADIDNRLASDGASVRQHYWGVYPTLHLSRPLGERSELQLAYSLRVNRPDGSDMNPAAERINPLSLQAGNPNLKPEKIHSAEAGWLYRHPKATLTATLFYRYLTNQLTEMSRQQADGILVTTKENLRSSHNAGLELLGNLTSTRWLTLNVNANAFYSQIDASRLGFSANKNTWAWTALLTANVTPVRNLTLQLNARFRSATLVPQGRRDGDTRLNLGVKYDIPRWRLSILGSVTDLLDTYRKSFTLDTPELQQHVTKRRNPRILYLGLSWQISGHAKRHKADVEYDEGL